MGHRARGHGKKQESEFSDAQLPLKGHCQPPCLQLRPEPPASACPLMGHVCGQGRCTARAPYMEQHPQSLQSLGEEPQRPGNPSHPSPWHNLSVTAQVLTSCGLGALPAVSRPPACSHSVTVTPYKTAALLKPLGLDTCVWVCPSPAPGRWAQSNSQSNPATRFWLFMVEREK